MKSLKLELETLLPKEEDDDTEDEVVGENVKFEE